jgi:hypothetical protein
MRRHEEAIKALQWTGISMAPTPTGLVVDIFVWILLN